MKKLRSAVAIMISCVILLTCSMSAGAVSTSDPESGIMLLKDWSETVFLHDQTGFTTEFMREKATTSANRYTINFSNTAGPTSVRLYVYELYSDGAYIKRDERTLNVGETTSVINIEVGNTIFATALLVSGIAGNATFHITAFN